MDLWNNPMMNDIRKKMSPEEILNYEKKGEQFYGQMNFEELEKSTDFALFCIKESLKSGLHPSFLTEEEKGVLIAKLGEKWWITLGYEEEDLKI